MELSDRLKAVAGMVTAGSIVCDVGCDHGYVPVYLIQNQVCPRVIAMDVKEGPLGRAREHIRTFGLEEYIVTRLSDGVSALETGEADTLILAGMGGRLVIKILTEGDKKICGMREAILQPQSEIAGVRRFLREKGYHILQEDMVYEDGKYYPMMKVTCMPGHVTAGERQEAPEICREAWDRYGEDLLRSRHPVLHRYLLWEQERDAAVRREIEAAGAKGTERHRIRESELKRAEEVRTWALACFDRADGSAGPDGNGSKGR